MKQLDVNKILDAVKKARYQYANGTLNQDIQNSTTPEFWSQTRNSTLKKQQIIQLAKSNHPRPHSRKHPLGFALNNYTDPRKSTYDPKFTNIFNYSAAFVANHVWHKLFVVFKSSYFL